MGVYMYVCAYILVGVCQCVVLMMRRVGIAWSVIVEVRETVGLFFSDGGTVRGRQMVLL